MKQTKNGSDYKWIFLQIKNNYKMDDIFYHLFYFKKKGELK